MNKDILTSCRVAVFECKVSDELYKQLGEISDECKEVANRYFQEWQAYQVLAGSRVKLQGWLDELKAFHKTEDVRIAAVELAAKEAGKKPAKQDLKRRKHKIKCPVDFLPPGWKPYSIRKDVIDSERTSVKGRCVDLLLNRIDGDFRKRKDVNGRISGWMSVLLNRENPRSFTKGIPIPFDKVVCEFIPPGEGEDWALRLGVSKAGYETITLLTKKRKAAKQRIHLERIANGRYAFKGSQIYRDRKTNKWMVAICYEDTLIRSHSLDESRTAILSPARHDPWVLHKDGKVQWRGGTGRHVTAMRERLSRERIDRSQHYKWSGGARKGRGGKKARDPWEKLSSRWKHFQKRYNNEVTTSVVNELVRDGIGSLVYFQPQEKKAEKRFLSATGGGSDRLIGWEYFQVKTMLEQKCKRAGIEFSVKKFGATRDGNTGSVPRVAQG